MPSQLPRAVGGKDEHPPKEAESFEAVSTNTASWPGSPSWLTMQGKQQHAWPSSKGKTMWPTHFPFSNLPGLYQLGLHQQSLGPSGWGGKTNGNPVLGESNQAY